MEWGLSYLIKLFVTVITSKLFAMTKHCAFWLCAKRRFFVLSLLLSVLTLGTIFALSTKKNDKMILITKEDAQDTHRFEKLPPKFSCETSPITITEKKLYFDELDDDRCLTLTTLGLSRFLENEDRAVEELSEVKKLNLDTVSLKAVPMTEKQFYYFLGKLNVLEELQLPSGMKIDAEFNQQFRKLRKLKKLKLSFLKDENGLEGLSKHPLLNTVEIFHAPLLRNLTPLSTLPNLNTLKISMAYAIRDGDLKQLEGAKQLIDLELTFCDSTSVESYDRYLQLDPLRNLPRLKTIKISADRIGDLSCLQKLPSLENLALTSWKHNMNLLPLAGHPGLKKIQVCKADIENHWKVLLTFPKLKMVFGDGIHALTKEQKNAICAVAPKVEIDDR